MYIYYVYMRVAKYMCSIFMYMLLLYIKVAVAMKMSFFFTSIRHERKKSDLMSLSNCC